MNTVKYHLGCGNRVIPGYIHIDGGKYMHVKGNDVYLTPIETDSADVIYSSHLLAYFNRDEAIALLTEWHRVLKPGGILRIAVPDFEAMARLLITGPKKYPIEKFLGPLYGRMKMNGEEIYHKTCYTFESLKDLLLSLDFDEVRRYDWRNTEHADIDDHSQAYLPHLNKINGNLISLNVECTK